VTVGPGQRHVYRQGWKPEGPRPLRVELDLARGRGEDAVRVGDVGDAQGANPALGAQRGDGRAACGRMIEDRVDRALVGLPREEVYEVQAACQLLEHPR